VEDAEAGTIEGGVVVPVGAVIGELLASIEGDAIGWMMTVLVLVDPVGGSAASGARTMTVRVEVAARPALSVAT